MTRKTSSQLAKKECNLHFCWFDFILPFHKTAKRTRIKQQDKSGDKVEDTIRQGRLAVQMFGNSYQSRHGAVRGRSRPEQGPTEEEGEYRKVSPGNRRKCKLLS